MSIIMVVDPTYKGRGTPPQLPRSWAMRKLYESGMSVGDIGRYYGVPYAAAYRAVNPERRPKNAPRAKPIPKDLSGMKTSRLIQIATRRHVAEDDPDVLAAVAELDRRDPAWIDKI